MNMNMNACQFDLEMSFWLGIGSEIEAFTQSTITHAIEHNDTRSFNGFRHETTCALHSTDQLIVAKSGDIQSNSLKTTGACTHQHPFHARWSLSAAVKAFKSRVTL